MFIGFILKQLIYNVSLRHAITAVDSLHLLLWTLNTDADIMITWAHNHSIGMTQQVQAILEECWFEWHKAFKLIQINWSLKQLPVWIVWEVREDKL